LLIFENLDFQISAYAQKIRTPLLCGQVHKIAKGEKKMKKRIIVLTLALFLLSSCKAANDDPITVSETVASPVTASDSKETEQSVSEKPEIGGNATLSQDSLDGFTASLEFWIYKNFQATAQTSIGGER